MHVERICLILLLLLAACGKKSASNNGTLPITEPTPEFVRVPEDLFGIELSQKDAFSFPIRMKGSSEGVDFELKCKSACPKGFSLSTDGIFTWNPQGDVPVDPYFSVDVTAKSKQSLAANSTFGFRITSPYYQIGDTWDKQSPLRLAQSPEVIALKDVVGEDVFGGIPGGTVEYLGFFGGKHLILSATHVFANIRDSKGVLCDATRTFYFTESKMAFSCTRELFTSSEADYAIYEATPLDNPKFTAPLGSENYPKFSAKVEEPGQPLSIGGYGDYRNPYRDLLFSEGDSCMTYISTERKVDYSKINGINSELLKNPMLTILGAPCEASSGDSGGPVILRGSSILVGIISAGSRASFTDAEAIDGLKVSEVDRLKYAKLSYVSSLTMFNEISELVKTPGDAAVSLKSWLDSQFIK